MEPNKTSNPETRSLVNSIVHSCQCECLSLRPCARLQPPKTVKRGQDNGWMDVSVNVMMIMCGSGRTCLILRRVLVLYYQCLILTTQPGRSDSNKGHFLLMLTRLKKNKRIPEEFGLHQFIVSQIVYKIVRGGVFPDDLTNSSINS